VVWCGAGTVLRRAATQIGGIRCAIPPYALKKQKAVTDMADIEEWLDGEPRLKPHANN
jgi:hypothetical protein